MAASKQGAAETPGNRRDERACLALLGVLLLFHVILNVWFLHLDNHVIRTDEETHMLTARTYYDTLVQEDHGSALKFLIAASKIPPSIPAHPPLLPILGAGTAAVLGYSPDSFALVGTFMFMAIIVGAYLIAREFMSCWGALLAATLVSFTPSVFVASRFFMTDYPAAAVSVWAFYALLRSNYFRNTGWVFFFALLNGCGILFRTPIFLYYIVPAALVAGIGLARVVFVREEKAEKRFDAHGLRTWVLNCIITLVVSAGIFAPWYFHHLETFYQYWMYQHVTEGPLTISKEPVPQKPAPAQMAQAPADTEAPAKPKAARTHLTLRWWLPWTHYPVHVINNNLFLVLSVLALLGAPLALLLSRYRTYPVLMIVVWIAGAYVLWTLLIRFSNARYVLPVAPGLAILAAVPIMMLPARWPRRIAVAAVLGFHLFVYANLTVTPFDAVARASVPVVLDAQVQRDYNDPGLLLYKDMLNLGYSYSGLGPVVRNDYDVWADKNTIQECNYKDRLFLAMCQYENKRRATPGEFANFVRLGHEMRGMELDQRHFWKDTVYQRDDLPRDTFPKRKLRSIYMAATPDGLLSRLAEAEYVCYALYAGDQAKEVRWIAQLEERGFKPVTRFGIERFGKVPARVYGLLARVEGGLITIRNSADIEALDLFELNSLRNDPRFSSLPASMQHLADERFNELIAEFPPPQQLNENLAYVGVAFSQVEANLFRFRFIFRVDKSIHRDWRIYFHGVPPDKYLAQLPLDARAEGYEAWNFNPNPPTSRWEAGSYVIVSHTIEPQPIPYSMKIGFFDKTEGYFGVSAGVATIDFGDYMPKEDLSQ